MPKYRRKQNETIKAFKWTGGKDQDHDPKWALDAIFDGRIRLIAEGTPAVSITLHAENGQEIGEAKQGDYIILWDNGYLTAESAEKFEDKWERV